MTPYEAYRLYLSIKHHFEIESYNAVKYNFKVSATIQSFEKRRDRFHFAKLAKHKDVMGYLVANFACGDSNTGWIGDMLDDEHEKVYTDWLARNQSLSYLFQNDLDKIRDGFIDYFKVVDGQHPRLLVMFKRKEIIPETIVILNNWLNFFEIWDKKINDTVLWPKIRHRCIKYHQFLQYDSQKFKKMIKDVMVEQINDK